MNDNTNLENIAAEETDELLPDGWTEDADFFDTKTWSGGEDDPDEDDFFAEEKDDEPAEDGKEEPESPTTGTEPGETETAPQETADADNAAPTTETAHAEAEPAKNKLRFKARVDHEDVDAEIDESELPTLYQKAAATDRYQKKLAETTPLMERLNAVAKRNGYETVEAMLDAQESHDREQLVQKLMDEGAGKTLAEDYADRQFGKARHSAEAPAEQYAPESAPATPSESVQDSPSAARDLAAEISELWSMRPDLRGTVIPSEVAAAAAQGQNLVMAYLNYENKQARAAAENLRKENEIYKQNAAAAAKAPVRGVSNGGKTNTEPEDPFMRGFDSGW